jgi:phage anti-repressor protein
MKDIIEMKEIILNGTPQQTVDARVLHAFLGVGRDFSNWIKGRIEEYEFIEGEDYLLIKSGNSGDYYSPVLGNVPVNEAGEYSPNLAINTRGRGRPEIEYLLTLNMAKELAMVERTEKGREARRYFIACERQLKETMKQEQGLSLEAELIQRASRYHLGGFNKSMINRFVWQNGTALAQQAFHRAAAALCSIMEREKLKHKLEQLTIIQGIKRTAKAKQRIQDDIDHINWLLAQSEAEQ